MEIHDYAESPWVRACVWWSMLCGVACAVVAVWYVLSLVPQCIDALAPFTP